MLNSIADVFYIAIKWRLRIIFGAYFITTVAMSYYVFVATSVVDWNWLYQIMFPMSAISCLMMFFKTEIGKGSIYLMPLGVAAFIRDIDIWQNFFSDTENFDFGTAVLGSVGWTLAVISIIYIDLVESRLYHRLVNTLDVRQETN